MQVAAKKKQQHLTSMHTNIYYVTKLWQKQSTQASQNLLNSEEFTSCSDSD